MSKALIKTKKREGGEFTYVEKQYASVIVGCDQVLRLKANIKPHKKKPWEIEVFYGLNEEPVRQFEGWYNILFESGFDVDQALVVEFFIDDDYSDKWRLYGKGVEFFGAGCNCQYSMKASLSPCGNGGEMVLYNTQPTYQFDAIKPPIGSQRVTLSKRALFLPVTLSFMAEHQHSNSKKNEVYMSQDPKIGIGKPGRP